MSKAAIKTIYVAGTIAGLSPEEVMARFASIEKSLQESDVKTLNPTRGKVVAGTDFIEYEPNEIMHRDLNDIRQADLIFAVMPKVSIGTSMEIIMARMVYGIPVILVTTDKNVYLHPWIRSLVSKILPTIEDGIEYVRAWYL